MAGSPTLSVVESPSVATVTESSVSEETDSVGTAITATSYASSVPLISASTLVSSENVTVSASLPSTTWLFVTIRSSVSFSPIMIPVPAPSHSLWYVLPKKLCTSSADILVIDTMDGITLSTTPDTSDVTTLEDVDREVLFSATLPDVCVSSELRSSPRILLPTIFEARNTALDTIPNNIARPTTVAAAAGPLLCFPFFGGSDSG